MFLIRAARKSILVYFFYACVLIPTSCKNKYEPCGLNGTIKDFLGQENCTLIIEDESGDRFVPSNLYDFGLAYYDGQKIKYSYRIEQTTTPCNLGVPITILCLDVSK